jgi:glutamate/tyrosine decarboxylase-like PLP-dependent enzyme
MEASNIPQGGELGLQGTRAAEVLKLWMSLQYLGLDGVAMILDSAFARASYLHKLMVDLPLNLLPGDLHLLCFSSSAEKRLVKTAWRDRVHQDLLDSGYWLSKPDWRELPLLKAVLGNPFTTDSHLEQLAEIIAKSL